MTTTQDVVGVECPIGTPEGETSCLQYWSVLLDLT